MLKVLYQKSNQPFRAALLGLVTVSGVAWAINEHKRLTPEQIAEGRDLFLHEWSVNDPLSGGGDGLGPVFNAKSCVACHSQGGVGGGGGIDKNVLTFQALPDENRSFIVEHVVHHHSTEPQYKETRKTVLAKFPPVRVELNSSNVDGRPSFVDRPIVDFESINSPPLFGIGVIDEISDGQITSASTRRAGAEFAAAFSGKMEGNHNGRFVRRDGGIGKFGWRGQFATVKDFVASACAMELGLTNSMNAQPMPREHHPDEDAKNDMTDAQLRHLVGFLKGLPEPEQIWPTDPEELAMAKEGEALFHQVQCSQCHIPDIGNAKGIYTDFKLYSLDIRFPGQSGSSYLGGGPPPEDETDTLGRRPKGSLPPDLWQTPPLWGVADSAPYFHDGESGSLEAAIHRHHGDADLSRRLYIDLGKERQKKLVAFLKTLRAPRDVGTHQVSDDSLAQTSL